MSMVVCVERLVAIVLKIINILNNTPLFEAE